MAGAEHVLIVVSHQPDTWENHRESYRKEKKESISKVASLMISRSMLIKYSINHEILDGEIVQPKLIGISFFGTKQ